MAEPTHDPQHDPQNAPQTGGASDAGVDDAEAGDFERYALVGMMTLVVLCLLFVDGLRERTRQAAIPADDRLLHIEMGGEIGGAAPVSPAAFFPPASPAETVVPRETPDPAEHAEQHSLPAEMRPAGAEAAPPPEALVPAAPETPAAATRRTYVVASGDTLSAIARRELGSSNRALEIARLNELDDPDALQEGQQLVLPAD